MLTWLPTALFEGNRQSSPSSLLSLLPIGAARRRATLDAALMDGGRGTPTATSSRLRALEHAWTPEDDALLKKVVDKYPGNWILIADAFNSLRITIPVDKRSPLDCQERWRVRFGGAAPPEEDSRPPPTPTTQMTTRGTKRSLSTSISAAASSSTAGASQAESRKRRRHNLMHDAIRKAVKKREATQKASGRLLDCLCFDPANLARLRSCGGAAQELGRS